MFTTTTLPINDSLDLFQNYNFFLIVNNKGATIILVVNNFLAPKYLILMLSRIHVKSECGDYCGVELDATKKSTNLFLLFLKVC